MRMVKKSSTLSRSTVASYETTITQKRDGKYGRHNLNIQFRENYIKRKNKDGTRPQTNYCKAPLANGKKPGIRYKGNCSIRQRVPYRP